MNTEALRRELVLALCGHYATEFARVRCHQCRESVNRVLEVLTRFGLLEG